jgi:hypothetical protein
LADPPRSVSTLRRNASIKLMTFAGARSLGASTYAVAGLFIDLIEADFFSLAARRK